MVITSIGENFVTTKYTIDTNGSTITSSHAVKSVSIRCTDNLTLQFRKASGETDFWPILAGEVFTANFTRARRESGGGDTVTWNICHLQTTSGSSGNVFVMVSW